MYANLNFTGFSLSDGGWPKPTENILIAGIEVLCLASMAVLIISLEIIIINYNEYGEF